MKREKQRFLGHLELGKRRFPAQFDVTADSDFRLQIHLQPISSQAAKEVRALMGKPGELVESLSLNGSNEAGDSFSSDTVDVLGYESISHTPLISVRSAKISGLSSQLPRGAAMRLWFRGFRSFRNPKVHSSFGLVEVVGMHRQVDRNEVSGYVAIHADSDIQLLDWESNADDLISFLHLGLGFASGKRLQTPGLQIRIGDKWVHTYYEGDGFEGSLPPIGYMNHGLLIESMVKRFERAERFPEIFWTVMGWLNVDTSFHEARFLMSMTALETLCAHVLSKSQGFFISKNDYEPLKNSLIGVVAAAGLDQTQEKVLKGRISNANARTLHEKLCALRDKYFLPSTTFSDSEIHGLTKLRNDFVHQGRTKHEDSAWNKIVFIREFLSQIIFRELGYEGGFISYLDGYKIARLHRF